MTLTGIGYDVHQFAAGRPLILGGVELEHDRGLIGHSDADVLTHAVMDALLGAAGLGDIGQHFPDSDDRYRDVRSLSLVGNVVTSVIAAGLEVVNVDTTVIMERPRLGAHRDEIRRNLAGALGLAVGRVNVKATTNEGIGFVGREEGVAALAVATLRER
jgi:2-C-methyl-D-erythritol 2,4-cyclodiphosphate synthase